MSYLFDDDMWEEWNPEDDDPYDDPYEDDDPYDDPYWEPIIIEKRQRPVADTDEELQNKLENRGFATAEAAIMVTKRQEPKIAARIKAALQ